MSSLIMAMSLSLAPMVAAVCATNPPPIEQPITEGIRHDFPASYDVVKLAVYEIVTALNVSVQGADETPERYQIRFMKLLGGVTYGEIGIINVIRVDEWTTRVIVNSERERRSGPDPREQQLADHVFSEVALALARQQPQ